MTLAFRILLAAWLAWSLAYGIYLSIKDKGT